MKRLSYANVMSTIAVFLALGGTSYAVTRNPVKVVRKPMVVSGAVYDDAGQLSAVGSGTETATCPRGYSAVGGGPWSITADGGALTPSTSSPNAAAKGWVVWFENYSQRSQVAAVYATCVRSSAV